jgi:AraC-like DNA-binding protein
LSHLARSAGLTGFVELALKVGVDPYRIAADAGVPAAALTDTEMQVPARAVSRMFDLAAARSGVDDFGLRIVEGRRLSNLGPIGLVVREQPTVRKALAQLARYIWLQNDAYAVHQEETGDIAIIRVTTPPWAGRQSADISLGVSMRVMRDLLGETWRPQEVRFQHSAPGKLDGYRRVFGRVPLFDQDFVGLVIDRADLDVAISTADPAMARQLARYLEQIADGRGASLGDKVREMIVLLLPTGGATVERVASRLSMDRRTLHRRLAAEGATFSELLNAARREVAETLLARSERSFQSVAELLGFSSLSAFAHWFRRQFACTASDYRMRLHRPASTGQRQNASAA